MIELYKSFTEEYPIVSIEDPFDQDDWEHYSKFTEQIGEKVQIVGDDLLVTNPTVRPPTSLFLCICSTFFSDSICNLPVPFAAESSEGNQRFVM